MKIIGLQPFLVFSIVLLSNVSCWGITNDLFQDSIQDGPTVSLVNDNFKRLGQGKLDLRPGDIIPKRDNVSNLGSTDFWWNSLYVSTITVTNIVMDSPFSMRNRIINGDMRINQRNPSGTYTINTAAGSLTLDRWEGDGQNTDGVFTVKRSTVLAPASEGFTHCLVSSITTTDASIGASQVYIIRQKIEGLNIGGLAFGTSGAKSITLSFWVHSTLTGTFGGVFQNSGSARSYPFTYTINSANTWEKKTITAAGDTSGTWLTDTGIGLTVIFSLGAGSSVTGTPGAWATAVYWGATGQTNVIGTSNATLLLTGVQVEEGTVATPFERRLFGLELSLSQRYYEKSYNLETTTGTATTTGRFFGSRQNGTFVAPVTFVVRKRIAPTMTMWSDATGTVGRVRNQASSADETAGSEVNEYSANINGTTATVGHGITFQWSADAEL